MIEICEEIGVLLNRFVAGFEKELAADERNIAHLSNGHYPGPKWILTQRARSCELVEHCDGTG